MPRYHVPCIYNCLSHCYMTPLCPSCIIMLTGLLNCSNMWCLLCDMCRNYGVGVEVGVRMTRRCPTEQRTVPRPYFHTSDPLLPSVSPTYARRHRTAYPSLMSAERGSPCSNHMQVPHIHFRIPYLYSLLLTLPCVGQSPTAMKPKCQQVSTMNAKALMSCNDECQ